MVIELQGMTWDHERGIYPMIATSRGFRRNNPDVLIGWDKRSLQAFADRPLGDMAESYDLIVIDHPHVGEAAASGELLPLNLPQRKRELAKLAANSVGSSHQSYEFDGRQWALAIDAAAPVAAYRPDQLAEPPDDWQDVLALARQGLVGFSLIPLNALMVFMGLARNLGFRLAADDQLLIRLNEGEHVLDLMKEIVALVDPRCLSLDPIGILNWMTRYGGRGPIYSPFGYGYSNYSRDGYRQTPIKFVDAPGLNGNGPRGTVLGGCGIAVSAHSRYADIAVDYAFWVAGEDCQCGQYFEVGGQPGHAAAWESDHCNASTRDFFRNTRQTLETAWLRPRYRGYIDFQNRAGDVIHAYLLGNLSRRRTVITLNALYARSRG